MPRPLLRLSKALLAMADGTPPDEIRSDLKDLGLQRIDQKTYQGRSYCLASSTRAVPSGPTGRRVAILHCHIFKNAGSSVDILLRETFGTRFIQQEFATRQGDSNADLVRSFIRCRTDMDAFSTHTGDWWLHYGDKDLLVLPILFLRHPLLRIQSAYRFERTQDADTYGARMAKTLGFADYVRNRLERPRDFAFRNFQARRVAAFESRTITDLASLARTGFERLPFLGIVEDFDASIRRLEAYLRPHFPAFTARPVIANRTDGGTQSLAERLDAIRSDLGKDLYRDLRNANDLDFHLYDAARARDALAA
ncbi:MAG: sulfotransferase family 2 domain-containing protein [Alphaproteobacteria bacterium]